MREEAAENRLLQLLRERDKVGSEEIELKTRPKRGKAKKVKAKADKISPIQDQIHLLDKIFRTSEPSTKYTKIQNAFYDNLARNLTLPEQSIYSYIYRLSLGHHKRICIIGYNALGKATGIKSRETIRITINGLIEKKCISTIGEIGPRGTIYFAYLPEEIQQDVSRYEILKTNISGFDVTVPDNSILKTSILNISILNSDTTTLLKNSILKNSTVGTISTGKQETPTIPKNSILGNDPHIKKENKESISLNKTRENLVNNFYKKLNARVSPEKKLKGYQEAEQLLANYSPEEIQYTLEWAVKNVPDIQSFALIPHVIDQALKAKDKEEQEEEAIKRAIQKAKEQAEQENKERELEKRINEIRNGLSREQLEKIHQQVKNEIKNNRGDKKFGQDILVRVKENEIIRKMYLRDHT